MSARLDSADARSHLTLAEAAAWLQCHVETLRLRVRRGELVATRGRHGRYLIAASEIDRIAPRERRRLPISSAQFDEAWERFLERVATRTRAKPSQLELIRSLKQPPAVQKGLHRVLVVQALAWAGYSSGQIAAWLGISPRHVRRLSWRPVEIVLLQVDAWQTPSRRESRAIVEEVRRRMAAAGFVGHRNDPHRMRRPSPAFPSQLSTGERRRLSLLGFTFREIEAMDKVRLGADELNYVLMYGRPTGEHRA